jgi:MFS family permease
MIPADFVKFAVRYKRFLGFGFLAAFASSFGQTYFIGIFGPALQSEFGLSHTAWGTIYLIGTLASSALLPFTGKLIDQVPLHRYSLYVGSLLILACGVTSLVSGVVTLLAAIFLLRHTGQGLMSHIAITTMARYFQAGRGRAIAIAALGYSVGEALLPLLAVVAIAAYGWRWTYSGAALFIGLLILPILLLLIIKSDHHPPDESCAKTPFLKELKPQTQSWTRGEVLHDPRVYLLLPGLLAPSIISTAMFFHHLMLADAKGWSHTWVTGSYMIYAVATIVMTLATGNLIDRLGAVRLVPFMLFPLILAMIVVASFSNPYIVWLYMILLGINSGLVHTLVAAMVAELYGSAHLGAIRSLFTAVGVFGTALGPVSLGSLVDWGFSIEQVCLLFAGYAAVGSGLVIVAFRQSKKYF